MQPSTGKIYCLDYNVMAKQAFTIVYTNKNYTYAKPVGHDGGPLIVYMNKHIKSIETYQANRQQYLDHYGVIYVYVPKGVKFEAPEFSRTEEDIMVDKITKEIKSLKYNISENTNLINKCKAAIVTDKDKIKKLQADLESIKKK